MKRFLILLLCACALASCCNQPKAQSSDVPNIIFETDMGNDVDDALALDLLYKYLDAGKINLLGITLNKEGTAPAEFIDILGTFYGYPDIPVGIIKGGADCETDAINYAKAVVAMRDASGQPLFARSKGDYESYPEAHKLYRKILASAADNSVTVVSVGFSTNLKRLLETQADEFSALSGKELVAKKVRLLCTMAGCFNNPSIHEYNVFKDVEAARVAFSQWPSPIVTSPFELGVEVCYPASSIEGDFSWVEHHPVVEAYKSYLEMPYDRPTWDLTSVLYAVENSPEYFTESPKGKVEVTDEGSTLFTPCEDGTFSYLTSDENQRAAILNHFVQTISAAPKAQQK